MLPAVDPVTVAVVGALVVFAILNRLRWQSKLAWFRRVQLERLARADRDDDARVRDGETPVDDDARVPDDGARMQADGARDEVDGSRGEDDAR